MVACTQPNEAYDLVERGDGGTAGEDTSTTGSTGVADGDGTAGGARETESAGGTDETGDTQGTEDTSEKVACTDSEGCGSEHYCKFPEDVRCGFERSVPGYCEPRPLLCPEIHDPVIGCDCGPVYENPCYARQAGHDVVCRVEQDECHCL